MTHRDRWLDRTCCCPSPNAYRCREVRGDESGEPCECVCHLPDDDHGGHNLDCKSIDKAVNDWIEANAPFCWRGTGKAVTPASVKAALGLAEGGQP